ncbi:hypothetical protein LAZ67_X003069, partial [Cordylochernes scorpioides]
MSSDPTSPSENIYKHIMELQKFNPEEGDLEDFVEDKNMAKDIEHTKKKNGRRYLPQRTKEFIKCRFEPTEDLEVITEALETLYPKNDSQAKKRGEELRRKRRPLLTRGIWRYLTDLVTAHATAGRFSPFASKTDLLMALVPRDCLILAASLGKKDAEVLDPSVVDYFKAASFLDTAAEKELNDIEDKWETMATPRQDRREYRPREQGYDSRPQPRTETRQRRHTSTRRSTGPQHVSRATSRGTYTTAPGKNTAIELRFLQPLMNCTSASQMWQKLLAIHEQKSEFTIGLLWQQFFDARLTSETISDYIAKIENISAQISQMGGTITEDQKVAKILNTLPSSMRYLVAAWESLDPKAQTLNNLTARLLIEKTRNQQNGSSKQDEALLHRQARTKPKDTQRSFQDAKKNTKCHYCHKIGHWSRECRKRLANEKNKSKNLHDSKGSSSDYGLILCDNQVEPNDIWYADSGASCSMTFRREWFKTYTPFTSDHPIYLGDNSTLLAEGMGDIEIQAYVDGGWYNTYIRNVLYSPQLKKNLYSLSTSTRRGFNVIIKHDKLQIFMDNDLKAVGVRHDGLYRMLFKVTSSSQGYITSENKLQLWHERLAHLPVATLREMATKGLVDGLQPQDLEGDFFFCEGCQLGKAHRKSCYPSDGKNYQLGEFIYADICGPMQTQSLSKYLYFCLFKDYFSGYRHIYFIKNKSDVLDIFKEYATLIYTQTGNKIKVLRTDNALEFKSDNFADLCKRFGIIHEFTAPYVHEQIGRIERDNRTIVEAARLPHNVVEMSSDPTSPSENIYKHIMELQKFNPEEGDLEDFVEDKNMAKDIEHTKKKNGRRYLPQRTKEFIKCRFEPTEDLEVITEALETLYPKNDSQAKKRGEELRRKRRPLLTRGIWRYLTDLVTAHATAGRFSPFASKTDLLMALVPRDCLILAASLGKKDAEVLDPSVVDYFKAASFLDTAAEKELNDIEDKWETMATPRQDRREYRPREQGYDSRPQPRTETRQRRHTSTRRSTGPQHVSRATSRGTYTTAPGKNTAIELRFLQPLMNCTSASQMWQKLLAIHEQKSEFTIGLLWQQFFDARLTSETISDYIAKIENISAQISQMGGTITEDQKVAKILNTLPSSMRYLVAAWESLDPKAQTLNNLTARLLIEKTRNQQNGSSKQDEALLHRQARTKPKDTQRSFQDAKKNTKCHYCHKIGHWSRECRKRLANEKNKSKNLHDSKGSSSDYGLILCDNQVEPNDIWYADSGASCSMTFRREWFKTYTPFTSDHPIYLGDNSTLLAEGMGDIEIQAYVDGGWYNTYIRNVLYSPQLKKNLYSLSTSTRRGFNVIIKHDKLQIFMDNDLKAVGVRHDGLYRMLFKVTSSSQGYITSENKLQLWHERLAHLPVATLREMATKGLVDGLQPQDLEGDFFFCEGCQLGKAHRKSCYPSDGKNYQLGEFIYADICGPMQTQSLSKYLYFCLFKDYFSGYRHIYFIKNKSDVLDIFKEYATLIYTQTGNKIKVLRTDNALEFKSDNFADLCKRFGIIHEFTAPYVHEQIGRIERDNRTIVEAARSMLNSRNLPGFFWAEACNTATYILNRSATKQTPGTTPYELFFGTKPNVANYKIFDCNAYMHIPKENRKKWDNKSIKLMFLGYENTSKNFRLWDWKTRKIRISKDVTFDEKATPHSDRESTKPKEIIFQINSAPDESPVATTNIPVQEMLPVSDISSHPMITRSKVSNSQCNFALADEPSNYIDAITSSDSERWKLAMDEEIDALNKNKTWTLERLADGHKPIGCKWVYKIKTESDGTIQRFKARLVAKGYSQIKNVDYFDTFSPVVRRRPVHFYGTHNDSNVILALYVDDGIILSKDKVAIAIIMDELEHAFDITSGSVNFFVGLQIEHSEDRASIFIHQSSYIDKILSKFNMADCIPASVPMDPSVILTKQDCPTPEQKEKMPKFPFREAVGSLMFASCVSRPDITYAVSQVSKFLEYPGPAHCTTVKNIFRYLKGTPHMGILFTGQDQLVGYSDSDFARDVDSRKSTTGYAFMMNGGTVSWASQRQPIIALSTTESEYIAACSAAKELIWIRRLLQGIGCDITKETELYIDNQAAIKLVENPVFHKRTKHIDVRYHFIGSKHVE